MCADIAREPEPEAVPDWQVPPLLAARTVKGNVPVGVVAVVVVMVKVEVTFPPVLVTVGGLKEADAPAGNALLTLRVELQELPFPLKFTVTR